MVDRFGRGRAANGTLAAEGFKDKLCYFVENLEFSCWGRARGIKALYALVARNV